MNFLTVLIIILSLFPYANLKLRLIVVKSPVCDKYNRNYLRNISMDYHDTKLNADIDLIKQLQSGLRLSMDFSTRRIRSSSFTHFYEYSLDLCNMLSTQKNNIFKRWFSTFYNYGNFKRACPVPPNYYYLKNYRISELEVPPFLFAGLFRLEFQMIQSTAQSKKKDHIFSCEVEIEIK
ncbi:uncharacterized protein LOC122757546 [Drosophila mojavensis]|uniref:uncharacterized protein LOC122757546 n=1 Tax=Drosophila mojavensis TaxID=7230 RepID=UPI001CD0ECED|nr:uncharacterized protein LOC122757546 [Drosophila mojavensis]